MKAQEVSKQILDLFQNPETLPEKLSRVFIKSQDTPCDSWSWRNQLLAALANTSDARGYRQWQEVGRQVRKRAYKGEQIAFHILVPCVSKDKDTGEIENTYFKSAPVFRIEDTDGDELPKNADKERILKDLPFVEVAKSWGLDVVLFNGSNKQGFFSESRNLIGLGVENHSVFLHELIHAADSRLGTNIEKGQHYRSETVAEFGAAVLAECIDFDIEPDLGGCYEYIEQYAKSAGKTVNSACLECLDRICESVELILRTADKLAEV